MTMEKRGVIDEQCTPPENADDKPADLENHMLKRAADVAKDTLRRGAAEDRRS